MPSATIPNVKKFNITNIENGYNSFDKVRNFYKDLRQTLGEPFFSSSRNLVTINYSYRDCGYFLELFRGDVDVVATELFSSWTGYAHESSLSSHPNGENARFIGLDITLSDEEKRIVSEILKLTKKYPSKSKGRL